MVSGFQWTVNVKPFFTVSSSILAWCHLDRATQSNAPYTERLPDFQKAGIHYLAAAECFPEDEKWHVHYLRKHLECLIWMGKPLRSILPLCERIRVAADKASEIFSAAEHGMDLREDLEQVTKFERDNRRKLERGECTLDSVTSCSLSPPKPQPLKTGNQVPFKVTPYPPWPMHS